VAKGVGASTVADNFAFSYSPGGSTAPVNAGTYTMTASFTSTDPNYTNATGAGPLTINQARVIVFPGECEPAVRGY